VKIAYLAPMGEKTREQLKLESYVRDQRSFAGRVVVRMEELGLQASDLAAACGVSVTAVGFILTGSTKYPRPETLFALADLLGLEARWLGIGEGKRLSAAVQHERKRLLTGRDVELAKPTRQREKIRTGR
jgi:transcriptional regulator with XRE-family HTH domain